MGVWEINLCSGQITCRIPAIKGVSGFGCCTRVSQSGVGCSAASNGRSTVCIKGDNQSIGGPLSVKSEVGSFTVGVWEGDS